MPLHFKILLCNRWYTITCLLENSNGLLGVVRFFIRLPLGAFFRMMDFFHRLKCTEFILDTFLRIPTIYSIIQL